jgi:hypothetical protein
MPKLAPLFVVVLCTMFVASPALADECQGVTMPAAVRVDGQRLALNGMGVREATVFNVNVYVAGLYVEGGRTRNATQVLETARRKQLVLHFVREVERGDITEAFTTGLRQSAGGSFGSMRNQLNQLNRWMANMAEGDRMAFTYVPGTGLEVKVKGRVRGTIEGDDFAQAFFGIWLGSHPPNPGIRTGLLGGNCG